MVNCQTVTANMLVSVLIYQILMAAKETRGSKETLSQIPPNTFHILRKYLKIICTQRNLLQQLKLLL